MEKKGKKNIKKKEVCEKFNVKKEGNEAIVESCGIEEEKVVKRGQIKKQNELFKKIIFVMAGFLIFFLIIFYLNSSINKFDVEGVEFSLDTSAMQGRTLYRTSIPVTYQGKPADYNFWLRTNPKKLKEMVPSTEEIVFRKNVVFEVTTENLFCEGDWTIGLANILTLYKILGMNILVDGENSTYEPKEDYMFITITEWDKTEILKIDEYHYEVNVNNCEILPAFERLMLEAFIQYHKLKD
jgi:hypothetical protein